MFPFKRLYCIHGELLRLVTDSPAVVRAADDLLAGFAGTLPTNTASGPLMLVLHPVGNLAEIAEAIPPSADLVSSCDAPGNGYTLYRSGNHLFIDFRAFGLFRLDIENERMDGWLIEPDAMSPDLPAAFVRFP